MVACMQNPIRYPDLSVTIINTVVFTLGLLSSWSIVNYSLRIEWCILMCITTTTTSQDLLNININISMLKLPLNGFFRYGFPSLSYNELEYLSTSRTFHMRDNPHTNFLWIWILHLYNIASHGMATSPECLYLKCDTQIERNPSLNLHRIQAGWGTQIYLEEMRNSWNSIFVLSEFMNLTLVQ